MFRTLVIAAFIGAGAAAAAVGAAPLASASGPYSNCTEAHQDGRWDIPSSDPDYWDGGDRDGDGYACES